MPNVWLISDTHFGHANVLTFREPDGTLLRPGFVDIKDHDDLMISNWNYHVKPEDKVYHLGDVAICRRGRFNEIMSQLNGKKVLIKGDHDSLSLSVYTQYFYDIRAYHVLDNTALAHIPIHPSSLTRWKGQIHGHTHARKVYCDEQQYECVSVEQINYTPIAFDTVRARFV